MNWICGRLRIMGIAAIVAVICCGRAVADQGILVCAASSMTDALKEISAAYAETTPSATIRYSFASSGALAQQIRSGAPADVFVSAAADQMDQLRVTGLVVADTVTTIARNKIVLLTNSEAVSDWKDLRKPEVKRFALGSPASVPSGMYAQQCLEHLRIWRDVKDRAVFTENVRQTLSYMEDGNAQAGAVFATDAKLAKKSRVAADAPAGSHQPVGYPAAVVTRSANKAFASDFVSFLSRPAGQKILARYGFLEPEN
jgi:molybdate transport system substrate-binding protein